MATKLTSGTTAYKTTGMSKERGLVIIPDIMGIRPLFLDMVEDLAQKWEANVCAIDPFPESNFPTAEYDEDLKNHIAVVPTLKDSRIYADTIEAAGLTGAAQVGLIGFCMGAMFTLKTMANNPAVSKGVAFYPQIEIPQEWKGAELGEPLEIITADSAKNTLAILGDIDHYTPPNLIEKLSATGVRCEIFEGCGHGFVHDPNRPDHKPEEADQAWELAFEFLYR